MRSKLIICQKVKGTQRQTEKIRMLCLPDHALPALLDGLVAPANRRDQHQVREQEHTPTYTALYLTSILGSKTKIQNWHFQGIRVSSTLNKWLVAWLQKKDETKDAHVKNAEVLCFSLFDWFFGDLSAFLYDNFSIWFCKKISNYDALQIRPPDTLRKPLRGGREGPCH